MLKSDINKNLVFASITTAYIISTLLCVSPASISDYLTSHIGLYNNEIALLSSITFIISGLVQPIVGVLTDKFGSKKIFLGSIIFILISSILMLTSESYCLIILSRIILGIGAGSIFIPSLKIIFETFGEELFNKKNGIYSGIGCAFGFLIASSILPIFIKSFGVTTFFILSCLSLVLVLLSIFYYHQDNRVKDIQTKATQINLTQLKNIMFNKNIILLQVLFFFGFGIYTSFMGLWAIRFLESKSIFSLDQISLILAFAPLGYLLGSMLSNFISSQVFSTKSHSLIISIAILPLSFIVIIFFSNMNAMMLMPPYFFFGFAIGVFSPMVFSIITLIIPKDQHGLAFGLVNPLSFFGIGVFQILTEQVFKYFNSSGLNETVCFEYTMFFSCFWLVLMIFVSLLISFKDQDTYNYKSYSYIFRSKVLAFITYKGLTVKYDRIK